MFLYVLCVSPPLNCMRHSGSLKNNAKVIFFDLKKNYIEIKLYFCSQNLRGRLMSYNIV